MKNFSKPIDPLIRNDVFRFIFCSVIVGMTFYFLAGRFISYTAKEVPESFGTTLMNNRIWFYIHIAGGTIAIILGPLQFWKTFRIRYIVSNY